MQPYTTESILAGLGYRDPLEAARQQGRMILLGRLARYQAAIREIESLHGKNLAELRTEYTAKNREDFAADDAYLDWQWYQDAIETIEVQLSVLADA